MSGSFRFTNADVLIEEELQRKSFCFENGLISDLAEIEVDASGYWILPGIVDLHGDGFEHHLNPRPSASFDIILGLRSAERELSANGITTAYFRLTLGKVVIKAHPMQKIFLTHFACIERTV